MRAAQRVTLHAVTSLFAVSVAAVEPTMSTPEIRSGPTALVSKGRRDIPHVEPVVAAHPRDARMLIGAAVTFQGERPTVVSFHSADGGESWSSNLLPECRIDPWVAFAPDGTALLSCMAHDGAPTLVYRSNDNGASWSGPSSAPSGEGGPPDRPVLAVGPAEGSGEGFVVYLAQGQSFSQPSGGERVYGPAVTTSVDGAATFAPTTLLRHDALTQQPFDAEVLPDGSLVVLFMDYALPGGRPLARRRTWVARSTDRGATFSLPSLVYEQTEAEMPWSLAVDASKTGCGHLYLVVDAYWRRTPPDRVELESANGHGLLVSRSDDCGARWSASTAVAGEVPGSNQETPAVAVNHRGAVALAWYDTRHADPTCFDVYFTVSCDGGKSFAPPSRLTARSSCPAVSAHPGAGRRWAFGGDYSGLTAAADGSFHALWAGIVDGVYQIQATRVAVPDCGAPQQVAGAAAE